MIERSFSNYYALIEDLEDIKNQRALAAHFCGNCIKYDLVDGKCSDVCAFCKHICEIISGRTTDFYHVFGKTVTGIMCGTPHPDDKAIYQGTLHKIIAETEAERNTVLTMFNKAKSEFTRNS